MRSLVCIFRPFAGLRAVFSHVPVLFIEQPMTKAVLAVHTKARVHSSLRAQDQHKNVSLQSPSRLFIPAFLTSFLTD